MLLNEGIHEYKLVPKLMSICLCIWQMSQVRSLLQAYVYVCQVWYIKFDIIYKFILTWPFDYL